MLGGDGRDNFGFCGPETFAHDFTSKSLGAHFLIETVSQ
jgi:hypothetical protein